MKWIFKNLFKFIYGIISFFNLQITLCVLLIGVILFFTGTFSNNASALLIFQLVLIASILFALVVSIRKLLGISGKVKKSKGAQIVPTEEPKKKKIGIFRKKQIGDGENSVPVGEKGGENQTAPQYFRVKNSPNMIMAEYPNRYELYQVVDGKMIKIRTDFKN